MRSFDRARPAQPAQRSGTQEAGASRVGARRKAAPSRRRPSRLSRLVVRSRGKATKQATPIIKRRLRIAVGVLVVLIVVLIGKVAHLQMVAGDGYREAGLELRVRSSTVRAERGSIFDRNGQEIALSVPKMTLYADPKMVEDPIATARVVAGLMQFDAAKEQDLAARLEARESNFTFIARQVDPDLAAAVTALGIEGIGSYEEADRMVVGDAARSVIGKTDTDGVGTAGLEMQYNDILTGKDGRFVREQDRNGRSIPGSSNVDVAPVPGNDLVLTLDRSIQYQVDQVLRERVIRLNAKGGTAVVMDTKSGDLLAIANVRRNEDMTYSSSSGNFAAVEAHETGSVAKVFSIAAAINEGAVTPDSVFHVPGVQKFDEFVIRDAYPHPTQQMPVREILVKSSNLGTVLTAQRITTERLESYLHAFGFGEKTGLDFPDESEGILKPVKEWQGTEKITVSYGYGFASTALQLVTAVNVVANNGTYVAPRLVSALIDNNGKTVKSEPSSTRPVLKPETAAQMNAMMRDVVCFGTGTLAKIPGMTVAGKTGTGYKVQKDGTYGSDVVGRKYFASFVGFLPAEDPQVTVLVSIDEPDPSTRDRFGGTAAAPVFSAIGEVVAREMRIRPAADTQPCAKVDPYLRDPQAGQ